MIPDAADLATWQADAKVAQAVAKRLNCTVAEVPGRVSSLMLSIETVRDELADARKRLDIQSWHDNPPQGSF